jgi:GT2 family glycosyltransferase
MKLAVVIVNYNVGHYLAQAIRSLYRSLGDMAAEVFVVDNHSTDNSRELIGRLFPEVNYIYNDSNVGFAAACNQAIRMTQAKYILLLNPDTILPESNISAVISFMESHPEAGACGVKMIDATGRFLPESKRGFPTIQAALGRFTGGARQKPDYYMSQLSENNVHSVEVLAGAYMMMRREALTAAGLLDEDYFMFGEDIELSVGITDSGFTNYYLPETILHYKGESTNRDAAPFIRNFYGAMGIFIGKHRDRYPSVALPFMKVIVRIVVWLKIVSIKIRRKPTAMMNATDTPKFIIFADECSVNAISCILKRNKADNGCHYIVGNERTTSRGHRQFDCSRFTHVLYDNESFSYESMVRLMERDGEHRLQLAVYDRSTRCIITPKKIYK